MRIGTLTLGTVGLLLAGALAAPPASATAYRWRFDERPSGLPTTTEPAQGLTSARADIREATDSTLDADIVLGAEPTEGTDAVVRLALGHTSDEGCQETWSIEFSSFAPTGLASRSGSTLTVHAEDITYVDRFERCGSVSVLAADGSRTVLDRLEEPGDGDVIVDDTGGAATVLEVENHRVDPGTWSTFWVLVGYEGDDATGLEAIDRRGDRVDVKGALATPLTWGARTWMPVRIRLRGHRPQRLELHVRPDVGVWSSSVPKVVWIRPRR